MSLMNLKYSSALNRGHVLKVKSAWAGDKNEPLLYFCSLLLAMLAYGAISELCWIFLEVRLLTTIY